MTRREAAVQTVICVLLMAAIVWVESFSSLDMFFQSRWFDPSTGQWLITKAMHEQWRWLFYGGMKKGVAIIGGLSILVALWGAFRKKPLLVRGGLLMAFSLLLTPLLVNGLKAVTDVYCPYELQQFGGQAVYQRILAMADPANAGLTCGRCFPGGHASGGFALTMIFFCIPSRRWRWGALALALVYAWIMGLYQMLRGDHFLSHTLMSMVLAWQVNILLVLAADKVEAWRRRKISAGHEDS